MSKIKKILVAIFGIISIFSLSFWQWLKNLWPENPTFDGGSEPEMWGQWIDDINQWSKTFTDKLGWILHLPQKDDYPTSLWYVMALIQISVNRLLWILAFIALVYMLYCGFLVFSSWSDDKTAAKGKKWISTAAIALAWIWISWLIISAIIRFINNISNVN